MRNRIKWGFRNIAISNVVIIPSRDEVAIYGRKYGLGGIVLEIVDGGIMENVSISNIAIERVGTPIFLRLGNRARPYKKDMERPGIGRLRNILISNVQACAADKIGSSISGLAGHPVENVTLENIRIRVEGDGTLEDARREIPEKPDAYPESNMFGVLPAYGFLVRHAENVKLRNVELRFKDQDYRPALVCDDVEGLEVFNLDAESREKTPALIWLRQVTGAFIHGCRPEGLAESFVRLDGGKTRDISLNGNDLSRVKNVYDKGDGVPEDAVHIQAQ